MLMNTRARGFARSASARIVIAALVVAACAPAIPALADPTDGSAAAAMFSDVPPDSWAYDALQRLAADGVLTGYANKSFKGDRPLTRYEVAVLVERASKAIEAKMVAGTQVDRDDIAAIRKLLGDFGPELKNVEAQVAEIGQQTKANTQQLEVASDQLRRMQVHVGYYLRPGTYSDHVVAVNGPMTLGKGASAIAPHAALPAGLGPAPLGSGILGPVGTDTPGTGQNVLTTGPYQHGTSYQDFDSRSRVISAGR
jgi:hypothetical protein